jgi:membrane protease subunit HflK
MAKGFDPKEPIDIEAFKFRMYQFRRRLMSNGKLVVLVILGIWLLSGFYIVQPDEVGVVKRFGAVSRTTQPGPHYHLPYPVESVLRPTVTKIHRVEIGFRTLRIGPPAQYRDVPKEALMLTGDENIVSVEFIVQYRIKDPMDYLFKVDNVEGTIMASSEAAIREVIGKNKIDEVLTSGKAKLQDETMVLLQQIMDDYNAGVHIVAVQLQDVRPPDPVSAAFKDVASAREDKEKVINQSQSYRNDIIPKAQGEAAQNVNRAQGYAEARIKRAEGEANRFLQTLAEYRKARDVIRKRIYIETMEEVLSGVDKFIIEGKGGGQVLPLLPLTNTRLGKLIGTENSGKEGQGE